MRIGVDIRCLIEGKRTGVEEYTLGVLRAMLGRSPDDTFVLFANSRTPMRLPAFSAPNVELRAFRFPNTLFNIALRAARAPKLDSLLGGLDVFFMPSIRLAPLTSRCPLVVTVHDLSFVRHPQFFTRKLRLWHRFMEPASLAQRAATLITVSHATARDVASLYGVPADRITVIPSGIPHFMNARVDSHPLDLGDVARCRERYRLPPRFLLFLGTLEPRKNLDGLLAAYRKLRLMGWSQALVLAGVRGWVREDFFFRLRQHPFVKDIIVTGFIADADKPVVYRLADVFVYPSFYEGFGFPPLEALACGTHVVTAFNSAIPEIAGEWAALANPYDPEELAEVLADRLRDVRRVPPDVAAAVRERYSWERASEETLQALRLAAVRTAQNY